VGRGLAGTVAVAILATLVVLSSSSGSFTVAILCIGVACLLTLIVGVGPTRVGTGFVMLALLTAPMDDVRPLGPSSFITFSDVFFALGFALLGPAMLRARVHLPKPYLAGSVILLSSGLGASVLSDQTILSMTTMFRLVAAAIILPALFMLWRPSFRTIDVMAALYVVGQMISAVDSVIGDTDTGNRHQGLSTHPNYFGMCGMLAYALCLHLLSRVPKKWHFLIWGAMAVSFYSAVSSGSRAALLVIVLITVLYPAVERSAMASYVVVSLAVIGAATGGALLSRFGEGSAIERLQGDRTSSVSDSERADQLATGFKRFLDHPVLGDGFSNAPLLAHNIYLEVAVVVGLIGLVGYLLVLWCTVQPLFLRQHPMHRLAHAALAYCAVGMLTNSLWDRFVWAVLGLAFLANLPESEPPKPARPEPGYRTASLTAARTSAITHKVDAT
jgi:O-antigen ligase